MNYLAIDTSGKNLTIILKNGEKTHVFDDGECGVSHSVELMPRLEKLCSEVGFDPKDADFFVAVVGAGSFTGIRIGVATVKALCFAYKKPCLSVTSFDTLAYNEKGGKVLAVIDAKHDGFYACGYLDKQVIFSPAYILRDQLNQIIGEYEKVVSFSEIDGIEVKVVSVAKGLEQAISEKTDLISDDLNSLEPLYVRKSQAEEGR